jgi:hypothetical protein
LPPFFAGSTTEERSGGGPAAPLERAGPRKTARSRPQKRGKRKNKETLIKMMHKNYERFPNSTEIDCYFLK